MLHKPYFVITRNRCHGFLSSYADLYDKLGDIADVAVIALAVVATEVAAVVIVVAVLVLE